MMPVRVICTNLVLVALVSASLLAPTSANEPENWRMEPACQGSAAVLASLSRLDEPPGTPDAISEAAHLEDDPARFLWLLRAYAGPEAAQAAEEAESCILVAQATLKAANDRLQQDLNEGAH